MLLSRSRAIELPSDYREAYAMYNALLALSDKSLKIRCRVCGAAVEMDHLGAHSCASNLGIMIQSGMIAAGVTSGRLHGFVAARREFVKIADLFSTFVRHFACFTPAAVAYIRVKTGSTPDALVVPPYEIMTMYEHRCLSYVRSVVEAIFERQYGVPIWLGAYTVLPVSFDELGEVYTSSVVEPVTRNIEKMKQTARRILDLGPTGLIELHNSCVFSIGTTGTWMSVAVPGLMGDPVTSYFIPANQYAIFDNSRYTLVDFSFTFSKTDQGDWIGHTVLLGRSKGDRSLWCVCYLESPFMMGETPSGRVIMDLREDDAINLFSMIEDCRLNPLRVAACNLPGEVKWIHLNPDRYAIATRSKLSGLVD